MADKKITDLPAATLPIATGVKFEAVQGGVNVQVDADDMPGSGGGGGVTSVTGTSNRVTSSGGATPAINIDAAYDAAVLAAAVAALPNGLPVVDTTGTVIAFAIPQTYGSVATPETGNVTLNATGLIPGMVQLLLHNHSVAPTFSSEFKRLGGTYITSQLNSIYFHAVSASRIEYKINQSS